MSTLTAICSFYDENGITSNPLFPQKVVDPTNMSIQNFIWGGDELKKTRQKKSQRKNICKKTIFEYLSRV